MRPKVKSGIFGWLRPRLFSYKLTFAIFVLLLAIIVLEAFVEVAYERAQAIEATMREKQALNEVVALSVASAEVYSLPAYKRRIVREVAEAPDVLYCRVVKPSGEIYLSSISEDLGTAIRDPALHTDRTLVKDDFFNGEKIKVIVSPTARGYTVWLGFSLREAEAVVGGIILSRAGIAVSLILATIVVYAGLTGINRRLEEANRELAATTNELQKAYSDLRDSQVKLIQSEKLVATGRLAASVAHEINNPLQGISNYLSLISQQVAEDTSLHENLEMVKLGFDRITEIVWRLRAFYRPPGEMETTDINGVVERVLALVGHQLSLGNVEVKRELAEQELPILGSAGQLEQVLVNLVLNAQEAMPGGGELTVRTAACDNMVQIQVSDTGRGISEKQMSRLFKPFSEGGGKGLGLGLWISHNIVEGHGGRIEVESQVGEGTTFTISLPAYQRGEVEQRGKAGQRSHRR